MAGVTDEETPLLPKGSLEVRKGTIFSSVCNLMNTCVGAGTLSVAYAFSQGGLAFSGAMFVIIIVCSLLAALQMVDAKRHVDEMLSSERSKMKVRVDSFPTLGEAAFGTVGKIFTVLVIAILLYLSLISYMIYARDQIQKILTLIVERSQHEPCIQQSVWFSSVFVMAITFIPFFPIYLLRNLSAFKYLSFFSILCIVFLVACVVAEFIVKTASGGTGLVNGTSTLSLIPAGDSAGEKLRNGITCLTYLSLTLVCHFNILPLERELKNPTRKRIVLVNLLAMLAAFVLYIIIGVFGYLSFLDNTLTDVTLNYPIDNYVIVVARGGLFFAILFSTPVLFHPTRESINILIGFLCCPSMKCGQERHVLFGDASGSTQGVHRLLTNTGKKRSIWARLAWLCEAVVLFGGTFLPACYIPEVNYVWNFVGSIGGFLVVYILPPLFYLRIRFLYVRHRTSGDQSILQTWRYQQSGQSKLKDVLALVILLFGAVAMIASNIQAVLVAVNAQPSTHSAQPCYYSYRVVNDSMSPDTAFQTAWAL